MKHFLRAQFPEKKKGGLKVLNNLHTHTHTHAATCVEDKSLMECAAWGDADVISELSCRMTSCPSGMSFAAINQCHFSF